MRSTLLALFLIACASQTDVVTTTNDCRLTFVPDPGLRRDNAGNGRASVDAAGIVHLAYVDQVSHGAKVATAADGLAFGAGTTPPTGNYADHRDRIHMPDGSWRLFHLTPTYQLTMLRSTDGINFTAVSGVSYSPVAVDNGTSGVYDVFLDKAGVNLTLLYLGDLFGANNTRRATSTDGGTTFTYQARNVLGDDGVGGGPNSYVDINSLVLPDGRRCLYAMKGGMAIWSFSSTDWITFAQEAGPRVSRGDWTEFPVTGLFDPTVIRLPDGRYRMYVTAQVAADRQALVSATTR